MQITYEKRSSWLDRPLVGTIVLNAETILFAVILILAIASRFYDLGARVMSHDENSHVYYSWLLSQGSGYTHDPITHGPFQFHIVAFAYFLFGDSDFSARIPAALFSITTVAFMWFYRRYLGRIGALVAAGLMLVSPYMLFYGRYVRNEAFVALFGVVTLWAILRYIETGVPRYLFFLTAATVLHFTTKETAFIYTAQAMIFLALYLVYRLSRQPWAHAGDRSKFFLALMAALALAGAAGGVYMLGGTGSAPDAAETAAPAIPGEQLAEAASSGAGVLPLVLVGLGALVLLGSLFFLIRGFTWNRLRSERSFDLLVMLTTLVLPMLAPFPVKAISSTVDYSNVTTITQPESITLNAIFVVVLSLIAVAVGLLWKPRLWLLNAALFYGIFVVLFTTLFTNGYGVLTGLVGALGYWLEQQGVNRGSQPLYYYLLLQVPVYEYLPALGSLLALGLAWRGRRSPVNEVADQAPAETEISREVDPDPGALPGEGETGVERPPVLALLGFWVVTGALAYTAAGEKMPWLTVHITLPMILLSGWAVGTLIEGVNWSLFHARRGWLVLALLPVFLLSTLAVLGSLLGAQPPFQGSSLEQLRATTDFIVALVVALASAVGLGYLIRPWRTDQFARVAVLAGFGFLAILTARTAIQAAYFNYDNATEYLVYAHSARGVKEALEQIEEISLRTTDGLALKIAYDDQTRYPYWWYFRDYTNKRDFGENPTRDLREYPVILVGDSNYGKIEKVVGQAYESFEYVRLWWPNQDYFGLTLERVWNALRDPAMRSAIFQIWLNRDYTEYGQATGKDFGLPNWSPATRMRLYIRKDIVAQVWNYGSVPTAEEIIADPYEGKEAVLEADRVAGAPGAEPGMFQRPRDLVVAEDGTLYVADTDNHRIQHLAPDGSVLHAWGSFADANQGEAPGGTFYEPWGIALGPDGSVYVADVWNHRIQKFTPQGEFVTMWGYFGQAEQPDAFWGPRDVAVDAQGRVFVTDTGNKRVAVFDSDGRFLTQFGETGLDAGQFDEPVGIAVDEAGLVYVADTWNQRIQVFEEDPAGEFNPVNTWDVVAWYGQSLDNKPYMNLDGQGNLFVADPEGYRVLQFNTQGEMVRYWGDYSTGLDGFSLVGSAAPDPAGGVWVSDSGGSRLLHFTLPNSD